MTSVSDLRRALKAYDDAVDKNESDDTCARLRHQAFEAARAVASDARLNAVLLTLARYVEQTRSLESLSSGNTPVLPQFLTQYEATKRVLWAVVDKLFPEGP